MTTCDGIYVVASDLLKSEARLQQKPPFVPRVGTNQMQDTLTDVGQEERAVEGEDLLTSLGVTVVNAAQVEQNVLAKASEQLEESGGPPGEEQGRPEEASDQTIRSVLKGLSREIRAVKAAVDSIDQNAAAEVEKAAEHDRSVAGDDVIAQDLLQQEARKIAGPLGLEKVKFNAGGLQRAGLLQRLKDLQSKQQQWEETLEFARTKDGNAANQDARQLSKGDQPMLLDIDPFAESGKAAPAALVETERDRLIRLGMLTPFARLEGFERKQKGSQPLPEDIRLSAAARTSGEASTSGRAVDDPFQKVVGQLRSAEASRPRSKLVHHTELPRREKTARRVEEAFWHQAASGHTNPIKKRRKQTLKRTAPKNLALRKSHKRKRIRRAEGGEDSRSDSAQSDESTSDVSSELGEYSSDAESEEIGEADAGGVWDDVDLEQYNQRLHWYWQSKKKEAAKQKASREEPEPDAEFDGGFRVPGGIFSRLFDYQKTGVKWMWELHTQRAGGIIGDEMGLGKTIQLVAFLAGLHHSGKFRASLVVCPATVLRQWLRELRAWYPPFRVAILHDSQKSGHLSRPSKEQLVRDISKDSAGVLVTSYEQLRLQRKLLLGIRWGYAILDEGHKIRNPDAEVTLVAKQLQTVHRIIMTGSPIQNRLTELWSLFDFVFPGKLGTLPVFQTQFALPIQIGGYSNTSAMQVSTAYKCAVVLRDLIAPYLLRRRKADVASQLPKKTEQVLFCSLTASQRDLYRAFLSSKECEDILNDRKNALAGIDILRKLCNHPDLLQRATWENADDYGNVERSGKHIVAMKVLEHWRAQGHRALVFTQTQQMLDIMERSVQNAGMPYHRMDGSTAVGARARLVDDFNNNEGIFAFLLTTKVGGIGINLTGADRVLVYDPDWNPSTDMQARERAWRIGQKKEVTVYRLITSGTIEEKVYHRQIYKQFLTNKVLRDPRQKRFFKAKDMSDLFQLGDQYAQAPETAQIFAGINTEIPLIEAGQSTALTTPSLPPPQLTSPALACAAASAATAANGAAANGSSPVGPVGEQQEEQNDTQMLRDLFEGTGVMSAMDHSKIEGANDPESLSVDAQAARLAKRAADALRRSRAEVQAAPVNVPTWTGRHGEGGLTRPAAPRRFGTVTNPALRAIGNGTGSIAAASGSFSGVSAGMTSGVAPRSADLLAHLKQRQQQASAAARGQRPRASEEPATREDDKAQALTQRIVEFLAEQGGKAGSGEVVAHFSDQIGAADAALFRQVLQAVAKLQRGSEGSRGKEWVLLPDFAEAAQTT